MGKSSYSKCGFKITQEKKVHFFLGGSFLSCVVDEMFIEVPRFQENSPALKISWLRTWDGFLKTIFPLKQRMMESWFESLFKLLTVTVLVSKLCLVNLVVMMQKKSFPQKICTRRNKIVSAWNNFLKVYWQKISVAFLVLMV